MTRKELHQFASFNNVKKVIAGYGCYKNLPSDEKEKFVFVGSNSGIYGWNWSAYFNPKKQELRLDSYRNVPNFINGVAVEW